MTTEFGHIEDPELRRKLEAAVLEHKAATIQLPVDVDAYPKFTFSRATPSREIGAIVRVRCALDETDRRGTIIRTLGRAYLVEVWDVQLVVHEPDQAWEVK